MLEEMYIYMPENPVHGLKVKITRKGDTHAIVELLEDYDAWRKGDKLSVGLLELTETDPKVMAA